NPEEEARAEPRLGPSEVFSRAARRGWLGAAFDDGDKAGAAASTSEQTVMPFYQKGDIRIRYEESSPPGNRNRPSRKQPEQAGVDEMAEAWIAGSRIGDRAWACVAQRSALIGNAA